MSLIANPALETVANALNDGQALNAYGLGIAQRYLDMVRMIQLQRAMLDVLGPAPTERIINGWRAMIQETTTDARMP